MLGLRKTYKAALLLLAIGSLVPAASLNARSTESTYSQSTASTDTISPIAKKSDWKCLPLPLVGYSSDKGFRLGAFGDIYDHGAKFPDYERKIHVEGAWSTKGEIFADIEYDRPEIFPGIRFNAIVNYQHNLFYNFFGFGGDVETFKSEYHLNRDSRTAYYSIDRRTVRGKACFLGKIKGHLSWMGGLEFWYNRIGNVSSADYDSERSLYNDYISKGIIHENEKNGGVQLDFKLGFSYDTRDFEPAPSKGMWAEAFLVGSPDFFRSGYSYLKLCAHFRHFVPLLTDRIIFAYHLGAQLLLAGDTPFHLHNKIYSSIYYLTYTEGLGGYNSLRGPMENRLSGNGYCWGNFELRTCPAKFNFLKQDWQLWVNPFFDAGCICQPARLKEFAAAGYGSETSISATARKFHYNPGLGIKAILNRTTILALDMAKPLNSNDGPFSIYLCTCYIF